MRLKILTYRERLDNFRCEDESGHQVTIDLSGEYGEDVDPASLVGRDIECEELIPYVKFPSGNVRIV